MTIKAMKSRLDNDEDVNTVKLREAINDSWDEEAHPNQKRPYLVFSEGDTEPLEGGRDKGIGEIEAVNVTVFVHGRDKQEVKELIKLVRACYEACNVFGDACTLTIDDRQFVAARFRRSAVEKEAESTRRWDGAVEFDIWQYRCLETIVCSSSSS